MGIPIIDELFAGIRWIISTFLDKAPKSFGIIIFLLFIIFFGTLLSTAMQIFGIHCDSGKNVVKVSALEIGSNLDLFWENRNLAFSDTSLQIADVYPEYAGRESECYFFAEILDTGYYVDCNVTSPSSNCKYFLKEGFCHNCTRGEICFQTAQYLYFCGKWHNVCKDNAYHQAESTVYTGFTGCGSACNPPPHYIWNITSGQYECIDLEYCGVNATAQADPIIDQKLEKARAERVYKSTEAGRSINQFILIKCNSEFNPRLTVFGVDLLDFKLWLLMIVIFIMVTLALRLKK